MITTKQISELVGGHLAGSALFLVNIFVKPGNRITVFIDGDQGVTIEECRELNYFLNTCLDRGQEDYDLTVSSSGADRPLALPRQFRKNLGKQLDIILVNGQKIRARVNHADESGIEVSVSGTPGKNDTAKNTEINKLSLPYGDIRKATEVITFKQ